MVPKKCISCGKHCKYLTRKLCGSCYTRWRVVNYPDKLALTYKLNNLRRYGLELEDYQRMMERQGGRCAICGVTPERSLHVDHDHAHCPGSKACSVCVRGLLCINCNTALGSFKDSIPNLKSAIVYLESE